jgi:hypothetical protein
MSMRDEVERHMASLSDAELVGVVELSWADYDPWAVQIARDELARRNLRLEQLAVLRDRALAQRVRAAAEAAPPGYDPLERIIRHHLLGLAALFAWPVLFVRARTHVRRGDQQRAKELRFHGSIGALAWVVLAVALVRACVGAS